MANDIIVVLKKFVRIWSVKQYWSVWDGGLFAYAAVNTIVIQKKQYNVLWIT